MSETLLKTPLYNLHIELGARMVPFAGYDMPVQYPLGVKKEHIQTRESAGLFDVSHMGLFRLEGEGAAQALEALVPVDIIDLPEGKQRYALFTNDEGGILDDLMVANMGSYLYIVVNAACKEADFAHISASLPEGVKLSEYSEHALVALQGPKAVDVLKRFSPGVEQMLFMDVRECLVDGAQCIVSRSGYTGEDGYEIAIPGKDAERITRLLLDAPEVEAIGLGARDSLRLESGLCLYGHDIDTTTTPVEGSLIWAISKCRRNGGSRAAGFPGADKILKEVDDKVVGRKRVGLLGEGRAPVREGAKLFNKDQQEIGIVTSGSFGPTVNAPVAMGYVAPEYAALDTELFAEVRGKLLPMRVAKMPFIEQRYYRG